MGDQHTNRRLAAILAADVVGYSRLMASDEAGTLAALRQHREDEFNPAVARHRGRVFKLIGDGTLVEFTSVVDAVNCAVDIQQSAHGATKSNSPSIVLRIGINLGDIILEGDDVYGNGVNIAARLEPLARVGGICVSSIVHESVAGRAKATFSDGGDVQVKNIDRPIKVWHWHPGNDSSDEDQPPAAAMVVEEISEAPSIAVLPFENMSGDDEQEYFSDGISEDIITDLSKVSGLLVIARNSSFSYKGKSVDLRTVGRDLGVSTVLEGSVRKAGNRVRITAQLIDAATGGHLWADRYDRDLDDIFAVQDEVTLNIVEALKVTLTPSEMSGITNTGTRSLEAHDCFLRARNLIMSPNVTVQMFRRAVEYGERAIALDPEYSQPYSALAVSHVLDFHNNWSGHPDSALAKAAKLAARGVELDPNDVMAHIGVSVTARWMGDPELSKRAVDKALSLNPNSAAAIFMRGEDAVYNGRYQEAIPDIERAIRLDPGFSHQYLHYLGMAHLLMGNDETAALMFRERLLLARETDIGRAFLAATLGHLGEIEEAHQVWKDLLKINPTFSIEERLARLPFTDPSGADRIADGLAKAALPG